MLARTLALGLQEMLSSSYASGRSTSNVSSKHTKIASNRLREEGRAAGGFGLGLKLEIRFG